MVDYNLDKRKYVIGGVAIAIVVIYAIRLFTLQIMSEDYKKNADSNAFLTRLLRDYAKALEVDENIIRNFSEENCKGKKFEQILLSVLRMICDMPD